MDEKKQFPFSDSGMLYKKLKCGYCWMFRKSELQTKLAYFKTLGYAPVCENQETEVKTNVSATSSARSSTETDLAIKYPTIKTEFKALLKEQQLDFLQFLLR